MGGSWALSDVAFKIEGRALVQGASLTIEPGRIIGVLGPNGAGKSTLLRLSAGLLKPSAGSISIDNRPLTSLSRRGVARRIAFVPQNTFVEFEFTAHEIAMMGRNPRLGRFQSPGQADRDAVKRAMKWTGTEEFAQRIVTTLSGGERQRVFLARALASESPFIALDEPTANLDIEHSLGFLDLIRELAAREGRGVLMAIHDLNLAYRYCDEALLLDGGRIAGLGPPAQTLTPEKIRAVFHVHAEALDFGDGGRLLAFKTLKSTGEEGPR